MSFTTTKTTTAIAKEVLQQLATHQIAPTPQAYTEYYEKISGERVIHPIENDLLYFAKKLSLHTISSVQIGKALTQALEQHEWNKCRSVLLALLDNILSAENYTHGDKLDPALSKDFVHSSKKEDILTEMIVRLLHYSLPTLLNAIPALSEESTSISQKLEEAFSAEELKSLQKRVHQLAFQIELHNKDIQKKQELLTQLFQLLLENVDSLLEKGSWLSNQISDVHDLIAAPISQATLEEATSSLKNVIYKQGILKNTLEEERLVVKNMMVTFVEKLNLIVSTTDSYHQAISSFSEKVEKADNIGDLSSALNSIMQTTRQTQKEALQTHDNMVKAQEELMRAQAKIQSLESQLTQMNSLVQEDHLTGSFNRRGMDISLEREMHRAQHTEDPLCIALLDLDDFKHINDQYGHSTGDEVLIHLVNTVKETLRKLDVIARFGGEEFLIILPETQKEDASLIITRIQRELSKSIFMHNNSNIFITFSAGIAQYDMKETQEQFINRADEALYKAKAAGKNRAVISKK